MTSSFRKDGELEVSKPANQEVPFLRSELILDTIAVRDSNLHNAELFGSDDIKFFQIGNTFGDNKENTELFIYGPNKELANVVSVLEEKIGKFDYPVNGNDCVSGIFLDYRKLPEPTEYVELPKTITNKFQPFSPYPFVLRDIAVWIPGDTDKEELFNLIKENAGELLVQYRLFDEFSKDGRTSYAYRLVFQSFEKTLTDEEVGEIMKNIESKIAEKGWEVR